MIKSILNLLPAQQHVFLSGLWGSSYPYFVSKYFQETDKSLVLILENIKKAKEFYSDIKFFLPETEILFYPEWEIEPYDNKLPLTQFITERLKILYKTQRSKRYIFITTLNNIFLKQLDPKSFSDHIITLTIKSKINYINFEQQLIRIGYERNYKVLIPGEFSVKGDIIDVFPPQYDTPLRIELYDDEIESIRFFRPETQISFQKIESAEIIPVKEIVFSDDVIKSFMNRINQEIELNNIKKGDPEKVWNQVVFEQNVFQSLMDKVQHKIYFNEIYNFWPYFLSGNCFLLNYFNAQDTILFLPSSEVIINHYKNLYIEYSEIYKKRIKSNHYLPVTEEFLINLNLIMEQWENYVIIFHSILPFHQDKEIHFQVNAPPEFYGNREKLSEYLKLKKEHILNLLSTRDEQITEWRKELFVKEPFLKFFKGILTQGFEIDHFKEIFLQDFEINNKKRTEYTKSYKSKIITQEIESIYDIQKGDFVVHVENGIGIYKGIKRIETEGNIKDYSVIEYAHSTNLYLPLEKINMLHKYIGDDDIDPPLNRLGTNEFSKAKRRVEHSIIDIAKDLIKTYAVRNKIRGFSFSPDKEWQKEFEASFPFVETDDQLRSLDEIKHDMENEKPMDRLLCGDVGYGKTEVAIRAAFKAVMDGKQVGILVPTTILSEQHYNTFKERMKNYPIKIEMLSRFKNRKEQKKIIKEVNEGKIDIIIGTHRLISPDVKFRDIGLVIIDEEQRFGVLHKEKFKILKSIVDVLTMSATPIPRTLYMSLSGIRDISLIDTPPLGRTPIETRVEQFSEETIRNAILYELERGGQIFFVHNRINSIYAIKDFLIKHVPEAKVAVIHGRMDNDILEMTMLEFVDKKFDVLITTTIIESGIDMPNVNTIIINRADAFGLSQLYQLRGRVGRSTSKAYAYLLYPGDKIMTETAEKRLLTIYEYSDLGAGYKIALRDLEIRGAGNIFGPQQHGNILAVGLELYGKILNQVIKQVKGDMIEEPIEPKLDFPYIAFIPDDYVDEKNKIEIYKEFNKCNEITDLTELIEGIKDRYGDKLIRQLDNLILIQEIKIILKKLKVVSVKEIEEKKYEMVLDVEFFYLKKEIRERIQDKLEIYKLKENHLYLSIEKNALLKNLKKNLLLII